MNFISIDASKTNTGFYMRIDGVEECGCVTYDTKTKNSVVRNGLYDFFIDLTKDKNIKMAFMEGYSFNPRNPVTSSILIEVGGIIKLAVEKNGAEVLVIPPKSWKMYTIGQTAKKNKKTYKKILWDLYGVEFETEHEQDAFCMYKAFSVIAAKTKRLTPFEKRTKDQMARIIEANKKPLQSKQ